MERERDQLRDQLARLQQENRRLRTASASPSASTAPCDHPSSLATTLGASQHQDFNESLLAVAGLQKAPVAPPVVPIAPVATLSTGIKQYSAPIFDKCFSGNQCDWSRGRSRP